MMEKSLLPVINMSCKVNNGFKEPPFIIAITTSVLITIVNFILTILAFGGYHEYVLSIFIIQLLLFGPLIYFAYALTMKCDKSLAYVAALMPLMIEFIFVVFIGLMIFLFARGFKKPERPIFIIKKAKVKSKKKKK